jgi:hypothetical protein
LKKARRLLLLLMLKKKGTKRAAVGTNITVIANDITANTITDMRNPKLTWKTWNRRLLKLK